MRTSFLSAWRRPAALALALVCAALPAAARDLPADTVVEAPGPEGPLQGALLSPASPTAPPVLLVPGSGPTDRDGNSTQGLKTDAYKLLAEALARRGIPSLRIDKRGMYGSAAAVADANAVTIADYADDVRTWMGTLLHGGAACVWLAGHSEGAVVVLAAAQDPRDVCGVILLAAPGRSLDAVIAGQLRTALPDPALRRRADAALADLKAGKRVDTDGMPPALLAIFRPQVQDFLIDAIGYDPAELTAGLEVPALIVQGGRDLQVSEADAERLAAADPQARLVELPQVNHVLKRVPGAGRAANLATYGDPSLPVAPGVVEAVAGFVAAHPPK
jgi:hypothetical protein